MSRSMPALLIGTRTTRSMLRLSTVRGSRSPRNASRSVNAQRGKIAGKPGAPVVERSRDQDRVTLPARVQPLEVVRRDRHLVGEHEQQRGRAGRRRIARPTRTELAMPSSQPRLSAIEIARWRSDGAIVRACAPITTVTELPATNAAFAASSCSTGSPRRRTSCLTSPKRVPAPAARIAACSPRCVRPWS